MRHVFLLKIFLTILLFFIITSIFCQQKDNIKTKTDTLKLLKVDSSEVYYFNMKCLDSSFIPEDIRIKKDLSKFEVYNPIYYTTPFVASLYNFGLAHRSLIYTPAEELNFDIGMHGFDGLLFNKENIRFYKVVAPFTDLFYVMGAKKEQLFDVKHYQNFGKYFNAGIDYRLLSSLGYNVNSKSNNRNFAITASYESKNKKYIALGYVIHNRIRVQESGGVKENSQIDNTSTVNNNISLSGTDRRLRETNIGIRQYLNLVDKSDSCIKRRFFNPGRICYFFNSKKYYQVFSETKSVNDVFPYPVFDTIKTQDSVKTMQYENTVVWNPSFYSEKLKNDIINFDLKFSILNTEIYNQYFGKFYFNQYKPYFGAYTTRDRNLSAGIKFDYILEGYSRGDNTIACDLTYKFTKIINHGMRLSFMNQLKDPEWFYTNYYSNHYIWAMDFHKIKIQKTAFDYNFKNLNCGIDYTNIKNYTYYNEFSRPAQHSEGINMYKLYLNTFSKLNRFELLNNVVYQYLTNVSVLRLPRFMLSETFAYNAFLNKKTMQFKTGITIAYISAYQANSYQAALGEFYVQNSQKINDYINTDFFISVTIKRARIFIQFQHFNSLFTSRKMYLVVDYPQVPAALKFGINWRFYN